MNEGAKLEICLPPETTIALGKAAQEENLRPETLLSGALALLWNGYTNAGEVTLDRTSPSPHILEEMRVGDWLRTIPDAAIVAHSVNGLCPTIKIPYDPARFGEDIWKQIPRRFIQILDQVCSHLGEPVSAVDIIPEEERHRLLVKWNRTTAVYPVCECIHEQFERQVAQTPEAVALVYQDQCLTYRELDEKANRLAHYLIGLGVGPEILVGVGIERSLDLMIALLAIMKAGGAYLPLDPAYPQVRLELVLKDAQPLVIVTQQKIAAHLPTQFRILCLDSEAPAISRESPEAPGPRAAATNLAYVIYTSGSTGKPKGVMIEHRNVVSFFTGMDHALGNQVPGVWLAVTSIAFDISVLELFWTITRGYRVILQGDENADFENMYSIGKNLRTQGVTHLQCTPSLARMLISNQDSALALAGLRNLLLGGEALPVSLAEQIRQLVPGNLYNMYGPTETTIWSTTYRVEKTGNAIPIGRPIANTLTYVLDQRLKPVPIGAAGELYIAGAGVARGYLRRPDLTAERFVENPFNDVPANRMYKTGDVARYLPDGDLEYLGRVDFQVKIRGFRIELGEIETVLERHAEVIQAVVVAREDRPGYKRLVAYVVLAPDARPDSSELRSYLRDNLPEHMQPGAFVVMHAMPLTANGKTDRNALPSPDNRAELLLESPYVAPKTDLEQKIVEIWEEALDADNIGVDSNFFDLGAHSLLVAEVHSRLKEVLHREIPLVVMFKYPTVRALTAYLKRESPELSTLGRTAAARAEARKRSVQQRRVSHS